MLYCDILVALEEGFNEFDDLNLRIEILTLSEN